MKIKKYKLIYGCYQDDGMSYPNCGFGITEDGIEIVPTVHETEDSAIGEFKYFSEYFVENPQRFPKYKFSEKEVDEIIKYFKIKKNN